MGGTAATLAMEDAGLEFRATKNLDIVLHIEALNAAFGEVFWKFVEEGRYEIRQASNTGRPVFYLGSRQIARSIRSRSSSTIPSPKSSNALRWHTN